MRNASRLVDMTIENNTQTIDHRQLGTAGPIVTSPGLGAMSMSGAYGPTSDAEGISAIHSYLDDGGNLIDTGDFYGAGHNEMLIGRALAGAVATGRPLGEFGAVLAPDGSFIGFDGSPDAVRNSLSYSRAAWAPTMSTSIGRHGSTRTFRSKKPWERSRSSSRPDMSGRSA